MKTTYLKSCLCGVVLAKAHALGWRGEVRVRVKVRIQVKVKEDLLSRRQLRGRRPLRNFGRPITIVVGVFRPALLENAASFRTHDARVRGRRLKGAS